MMLVVFYESKSPAVVSIISAELVCEECLSMSKTILPLAIYGMTSQ